MGKNKRKEQSEPGKKWKLESPSTGEQIDTIVYSYNGILPNNEKEPPTDRCNNTDLKNMLSNRSQKQVSTYTRYDAHIRLH